MTEDELRERQCDQAIRAQAGAHTMPMTMEDLRDKIIPKGMRVMTPEPQRIHPQDMRLMLAGKLLASDVTFQDLVFWGKEPGCPKGVPEAMRGALVLADALIAEAEK